MGASAAWEAAALATMNAMLAGNPGAEEFVRQRKPDLARTPSALVSLAAPRTQAYWNLVAARKRYAGYVAGGSFPTVGREVCKLKRGKRTHAALALRQRLAAEGFGVLDAESGDRFDKSLADALKEFQAAHLLKQTGRVGPQTLERLRLTAGEKLARIDRALTVMRRSIGPWEAGFVHVQMPQAFLELYADGKLAGRFKTVLGAASEGSRTVPLDSAVVSVILNPKWRVPKSISEAELDQKSKSNPEYFSEHNFEVRGATGKDRRFVQESGDENALGRMKLVYHNGHGQAIHGAAARNRNLFHETTRLFSHGCIRVHHSLDLAATILLRDQGMSRKKVREILDSGEETEVKLAVPVPVHVIYSTAAADSEGRVYFTEDYYGIE